MQLLAMVLGNNQDMTFEKEESESKKQAKGNGIKKKRNIFFMNKVHFVTFGEWINVHESQSFVSLEDLEGRDSSRNDLAK